jgi:hypothetical protein
MRDYVGAQIERTAGYLQSWQVRLKEGRKAARNAQSRAGLRMGRLSWNAVGTKY